MRSRLVRGALAAVTVASALAACSSPATSGPGPQDAAAGDPATQAPAGGKAKPSAQRPTQPKRTSAAADAGGRTAGSESDSGSGRSVESDGKSRDTKPAVSCMDDSAGDTERSGSAPGYADLVQACVRQTRSGIRLEITVDDDLPPRMPNGESATTLGFELLRGSTRYSAVAQATADGWSGYLTAGRGRTALRTAISGATLRMPVPQLDGSGTLRWKAESSWTRSTLLSTAYAFDSAPSAGRQTYRG